MASNKKNTKATDDAPEQDEIIETTPPDGQPPETTPEDDAPEQDGDEASDAKEAGEESLPIAPESQAPIPSVSLHTRLEKAIRGSRADGGTAGLHALNKTELLLGTLKLSLPEAIDAVADEQLKADLSALQALL